MQTPTTSEEAPTKKAEEPRPQPSRAQRRASMRAMNNKLFSDRKLLVAELERLQGSNRAMNYLLNDIVKTVGMTPPKTAIEGINAVDQLRDRIIGLVELEKRVKAKEEKENPIMDLKENGGVTLNVINKTGAPIQITQKDRVVKLT